jgi:hypothetical protein
MFFKMDIMFHYSISYCQTKAQIHTLPHSNVLKKIDQLKIYISIHLQLLLIIIYIIIIYLFYKMLMFFFLVSFVPLYRRARYDICILYIVYIM